MDEIKSKLFYEPKNGYDLIDAAEHVAVEDYCRGEETGGHEGKIAPRYRKRDVIHGTAEPRHKQLRAVKILSVKAVAELRCAAKRTAYKYRVFIIGYSHTYS